MILRQEKKIVELKKKRYTNSKIKEKTGVSLPTIRKILRENHDTNNLPLTSGSPRVFHVYEEDDILIVNLTRNYPDRGYSTLQRLRNGLPPWVISKILADIYPDHIVKKIIDGLNRHGGADEVYQVNITRDRSHRVNVIPLTYKALQINQRVE